MSTVPEYTGTVPKRTQSQSAFNTNVQDILDYQVTLAPAINIVADEINTNATNASTSESNASTSETNAETFALEASASANATVYSDVETYNYPETVIGSEGNAYRCLSTSVIGDDPVGSITGNWKRTATSQTPLVCSSTLADQSSISIVSGDLVITSGIFNYTNGLTLSGYELSSRTVTKTIDASSIADGTYWISENSDGTNSWFADEPTYTGETTGVSLNIDDALWYEDNVLMSPYPSFLPLSIVVFSGEIQSFGDEIATNVQPLTEFSNGLVASGLTKANANVKIVDFGTVVNNNRYVVDNPFGNDKWEGCSVVTQIYLNGMWSNSGWYLESASFGTSGHSNLEGIVVQTGSLGVYDRSENGGGGHGYASGSGTSVPCRVIVTYIGDATNA